MVPARVSISDFVGTVKGRATIGVLNNNRKLTSKPYLGEQFNIKAYSTVSSILRRVSMLKKYDRKIKKRIGEIENSINKGQQ
jgi:putative transposase